MPVLRVLVPVPLIVPIVVPCVIRLCIVVRLARAHRKITGYCTAVSVT